MVVMKRNILNVKIVNIHPRVFGQFSAVSHSISGIPIKRLLVQEKGGHWEGALNRGKRI